MADTGGSRPNQRYCIYCGSELRPGNAFCVSCGQPMPQNAQNANQGEVENTLEENRELQATSASNTNTASAGKSSREIYNEYVLYSRFFRESRDRLDWFSKRLKNDTDQPDHESPITHKDLDGARVYAQKGLNKTEEYRELLSTPSPDASQEQIRSALAELKEDQNYLLALVDNFYDKLDAAEGYTQFEEEFARWYTDELEPYIQSDDHRQASPEPPSEASSSPSNEVRQRETASYGGGTRSSGSSTGGATGIIEWFKELTTFTKVFLSVFLILGATSAVIYGIEFSRVGESASISSSSSSGASPASSAYDWSIGSVNYTISDEEYLIEPEIGASFTRVHINVSNTLSAGEARDIADRESHFYGNDQDFAIMYFYEDNDPNNASDMMCSVGYNRSGYIASRSFWKYVGSGKKKRYAPQDYYVYLNGDPSCSEAYN